MPTGYRKEYATKPLEPDDTFVREYIIELSERDIDALQHLKGRNGAGIGNIAVENIALWKMINRVCESKNAK